jgi:hypothetical protein
VLELKPLWYPRKGLALRRLMDMASVFETEKILVRSQSGGLKTCSWGAMKNTYTQFVGSFATGLALNRMVVTTSQPVGTFATGLATLL